MKEIQLIIDQIFFKIFYMTGFIKKKKKKNQVYWNVMGKQKSLHGLLYENILFLFSTLTLNNIFTILSHYLLPSFRQPHNLIPPEDFIFPSKTCMKCFLAGNWKFSIKRILQKLE